jgi:hypothetical protein
MSPASSVMVPPLRIAGKALNGVLDHLRREIHAQHIGAATCQFDWPMRTVAAAGIEQTLAAHVLRQPAQKRGAHRIAPARTVARIPETGASEVSLSHVLDAVRSK